MAEAVDRVERSVNAFRQTEIGHVAHDCRGLKTVACEPLVAILDRAGIEVQSVYVEAFRGKPGQQTPRTAGGLEEFPHFDVRMFVETGAKKIKFGFPVRSVDQVVILRIVVKIALNSFL